MNIKTYFKVLNEDDIEQGELKAKYVFRKEHGLTEQVASKSRSENCTLLSKQQHLENDYTKLTLLL
jgi:BMFP domain-containing protein YqiC